MRSLAQTHTPALLTAEALQSFVGEVTEIDGRQCRVRSALGLLRARLATHVPGAEPGQQVVLQCLASAPESTALVVAAYPLDSSPQPPLFDYDPDRRTLRISAARLELSGLDTVALRCGDASIRLDVQGEISSQGERILSAALGSHRIEGASVEIN